MNHNELYIIIIISIFLMIGFAIAVVWFFTYAQRKIIITKLKQKELEIIFQKELLSNAVTIQEVERDRISKELHDEIGSKLNIATLNMHLLKTKVVEDDESALILTRLNDALQSSAERTRTISHELMPPVFQNFGFGFAIEELQNSLNATGEVRVSINYYQNVQIKSKIKLLHIYRILQESISNTIKHAKATTIHISFEKDGENMVLSYKDNGLGFDQSKISGGMGMSNIRTRSDLLDGIMNYTSSVGKGFEMTIKFLNHD